MMIKHPDRQGLQGPRSQHYCGFQLNVIALPSLGSKRKKRQFHWQVLLACEATRAEESGMSPFLWECVWKVHFIRVYSFRAGRTPIPAAAECHCLVLPIKTWQLRKSWWSSREDGWQENYLLESFIKLGSYFLQVTFLYKIKYITYIT